MNGEHPYPKEISVTGPLERAIEISKRTLFSPADASKWFLIGFAAFLSNCGRGSGSSYNPRITNTLSGPGGPGGPGGPNPWDQAQQYIDKNMVMMVFIFVLVLLLFLGFGLLFKWLGSRGDFMFLDMTAKNGGTLEGSWRATATLGNSLFMFRAILVVIQLGFTALALIFAALPALGDIQNSQFSDATIGVWVIIAILALIFFVTLGFVNFILNNIVVPIMYARNMMVKDALRDARQLIQTYHSTFVLFLLMRIALVIGAGMLIATVGCVLCVVSCIPVLGQYLITVATLPISMFLLSYSACFMEQFGPEYTIFRDDFIDPTGPAGGGGWSPVETPPMPSDYGAPPSPRSTGIDYGQPPVQPPPPPPDYSPPPPPPQAPPPQWPPKPPVE